MYPWLTVEKTYEGFPLFLRRPDLGDTTILQEQFPILLVVTHEFSKRLPNGLPEADYNDGLADMDQDLVTTFDLDQNGVPVLLETFGGKRHYYFYVTSVDVVSRATAVAKRYSEERLSWKTRSDPKWNFIKGYAKDFF